MNIQIPEKLTPLFQSKHRFNVIWGGRDSGKSHTVARLLILKALESKCLILCTRYIQKSIATSSYALLVKIINEYELNRYFDIVDKEIRCIRTGAKFIFQGLWQNLDNIRSLEGVNYCWIEEAARVPYDAFDILLPTIRAEGSQIFITFNPDQLDDPVYDMFITHEMPDSLVIKINWDENPFLTDTSKAQIAFMRENYPDNFDWIYQGNIRATTEARILHNVIIHEFEIDEARQQHFGLDFGFNDPNALIQSYIADNELYLFREYYASGLDPEQLKAKMSTLDWLFGRHIIADSARPELIKMLNATGRYQVASARKNIGQPQKAGAFKWAMAMYLKQFKAIHIHATNCPNASREFPRWSWDIDKNEKILDVVADGDDHTVDAVIYSLEREASIWYRNNFQRQK